MRLRRPHSSSREIIPYLEAIFFFFIVYGSTFSDIYAADSYLLYVIWVAGGFSHSEVLFPSLMINSLSSP